MCLHDVPWIPLRAGWNETPHSLVVPAKYVQKVFPQSMPDLAPDVIMVLMQTFIQSIQTVLVWMDLLPGTHVCTRTSYKMLVERILPT